MKESSFKITTVKGFWGLIVCVLGIGFTHEVLKHFNTKFSNTDEGQGVHFRKPGSVVEVVFETSEESIASDGLVVSTLVARVVALEKISSGRFHWIIDENLEVLSGATTGTFQAQEPGSGQRLTLIVKGEPSGNPRVFLETSVTTKGGASGSVDLHLPFHEQRRLERQESLKLLKLFKKVNGDNAADRVQR